MTARARVAWAWAVTSSGLDGLSSSVNWGSQSWTLARPKPGNRSGWVCARALTSSKSRKKGRLAGSVMIARSALTRPRRSCGLAFGELRAAGVEELAASVGEGGGDQRVAGSEVVDEHPGAGLEGVREVSQRDLTALAGDEQFGRLGEQAASAPLVTRSTRCCNVVTGIGG